MTPRTESIKQAILALAAESLGNKIEAAELAAAAAAEDKDDDKPVKAKISISINWEAGEPDPEIHVKAKVTNTRQTECSAVASKCADAKVDGGAE